MEELEVVEDCDRIESDEGVELKVINDAVEPRALTDVGAFVLIELEVSDRGRITSEEVVVSEIKVDCTERLLRLDEDICSVDNVVCVENAELSEVEGTMNEDVASVDALVVNVKPKEELTVSVDEEACAVDSEKVLWLVIISAKLLVDCSAALLDEVGNMSVFVVTTRLLVVWLSDCDVDETRVWK